MRRALLLFLLYGALCAATLVVFGTRHTGFPPFAALLDPLDGLYATARTADGGLPSVVDIPGLRDEVHVGWDDRRVPHIFAGNDLDGVAALGYVVASDRLFQLDFIPRAASGRLAEALGPAAVPADRFLRSTGMDQGARENLERIRQSSPLELAVMDAYCRGVNAYLATLAPADLPFEFRLLGYEPEPCTPLQTQRVLQYMNYDLTYRSDEPAYGWLRERLGEEAFQLLYPAEPAYSVPIIPPDGGLPLDDGSSAARSKSPPGTFAPPAPQHPLGHTSALLEGFLAGKGSNNWAVAGRRSATGAPLLAGDMHLSVTLPAIWYEVHLVTPEMNVYGVTIPGAPVPVEAFNEHLGWTFTNTGADQIDHYRLDVDPSGKTYLYEGAQRPLETRLDTINVNGGDPVVDTLYASHWGPAVEQDGVWTAIRWTAHDSSRTLAALWEMNHARTHDEFQDALRKWDTPMQNILYADRDGTISIRSTGHLPLRAGGTGTGLLDGTSEAGTWSGRIPFDELPYAVNPARGYLTSTNQKPTDSTYAYYLGHDWGRAYRSRRIEALLSGTARHSIDDMRRYQADVHAVQRDFFVPLIDTLGGLNGRAEALRSLLAAWDGEMSVERREPVALHYVLAALDELTWDEVSFAPVFRSSDGDTLNIPIRLPRPDEIRIYHLLAEVPSSDWLDVQSTPGRESAGGLLRTALDTAAARLARRFGPDEEAWKWGRRHRIRFDHLIGALEPLGRGPFPYPGYRETLSPAADTLATHSASWRVVVDFSGQRPRGFGVYPGGQSGNPFSRFYDLHLSAYLEFEHFELLKPLEAAGMDPARSSHRAIFRPSSP
jgi:penicillin amidase